jgi:hypothetical protein
MLPKDPMMLQSPFAMSLRRGLAFRVPHEAQG